MRTSTFVLPLSALCGVAALAFAQTPCENLKSLSIPGVEFTAVETVAAGPYQPRPRWTRRRGPAALERRRPRKPRDNQALAPIPPQMLPAHCRVAATLRPSSDSDIKMEVWLPVENWNGKFQMVGNGGWAGIISFPRWRRRVREGYATASTDTGHEGGNGMFALGHPEKIVDFGWRAVHETVVKSKALIEAYYGESSKYSYWNGCSTGGRQALVEVTKFPDDFDGVVAGAPANPHIHLHAAGVERSIEEMKNPQRRAIPGQGRDAAQSGAREVRRARRREGRPDRRSHKCHFDPASLLCKGEESDACLTAAQVQTVKIVFADVKNQEGRDRLDRLRARRRAAICRAEEHPHAARRRLGQHPDPGPPGCQLRFSQVRSR